MITSEQLTRLGANIMKLGTRRLVTMAVVGVSVVLAVCLAGYYLARPAMQPIYTGLSGQDVSRISAALAEAGVQFDVNEQRNSVLVPFGQTARARTLLAQKGLPASARAGYELFDQMGSIGLTSFMQEVTRVRALEGEISRTIQAVDGVAAARVHLVMPEAGTFRRDRRDASASVLIRVDEKWQAASSRVVRQMVAAAVPGMKPEQVSVASADGRLLMSGGDDTAGGTSKLAELEKAMASEIEERASRTLASAIGIGNYQISATIRLDIDRQSVNETMFDPKSRIERSVRVVKQSGSSEEGGSKSAVGVESNVPKEEGNQADGDKRKQRDDRREELTNYELNSKTVQTVREGYRVQRVAIAVVVSRKHIADLLGANADATAVTAKLNDLKRLIAAATGANPEKEDRVEITAVDMSANAALLQPVQGPGFVDHLILNTGTVINAIAMLAIILIVMLFGVRPLMRTLSAEAAAPELPALGGPLNGGFASGLPPVDEDVPIGIGAAGGGRSLLDGTARRIPNAEARERLAALVEFDQDAVTKVLKTWMQEERAT